MDIDGLQGDFVWVMAVRVVEVTDHNEGNCAGKTNTFRYLLLTLLATFFIDIKPEYLSFEHVLAESWDD